METAPEPGERSDQFPDQDAEPTASAELLEQEPERVKAEGEDPDE